MKLSELMKKGAKLTAEAKEMYFEYNEPELCTCALGAAMYALDFRSAEAIGERDECVAAVLDSIGLDLEVLVSTKDLSDDIREIITKYGSLGTVALHDLVADVNDRMGRERAIRMVEELGY